DRGRVPAAPGPVGCRGTVLCSARGEYPAHPLARRSRAGTDLPRSSPGDGRNGSCADPVPPAAVLARDARVLGNRRPAVVVLAPARGVHRGMPGGAAELGPPGGPAALGLGRPVELRRSPAADFLWLHLPPRGLALSVPVPGRPREPVLAALVDLWPG